jgi:hypothetical protein
LTTLPKRIKDKKSPVCLLLRMPANSPKGAHMSRLTLVLILMFSFSLLLFPPAKAHARTTVLFDQGHGQKFLIERGGDLDLSALARTFRDLGDDVSTSSAPVTEKLLHGVDILVISGAFRPYTREEAEAVGRFVERGGAVCITLHIAPPLSGLLYRLGIDHSNSVIHEEEGLIEKDSLNFHVTRLAKHPLFRGVRQFSLYGGWALQNVRSGGRPIAWTSPSAWIDLNGNNSYDPGDARQQFAVAVAGEAGKGRFVVFGDDAIFQNRFLTGDNLILARNLAAWLAGVRPPVPGKNPAR